MKLIIEQSKLADIIRASYLAVSPRPTHPILGNILITAKTDGTVEAIATNCNLTIQITTCAAVEIPGSIALPAKLLNDTVANISGEIEIETKNHNCTIVHRSGKCRLVGANPEDFSAFPETKNPIEVRIPAKKLQIALEGCLYCASSDETKLVLTGVNFDIHRNKWQLASTNGHKLGLVTGTLDNEHPEAINFTVPSKSLTELNKIIATCEDNTICSILISQSHVEFSFPNVKVSSRLLEGDYPKINQLIPRSFEYEFTLEAKGFESALKRVSHLAERKQKIVKLLWNIKESQATLHTEATDIGEAFDSIKMKSLPGSGKNDIALGLNIDYALEGLKHISTSEILVRCNKPSHPVIICPVGGLLNQLYLVMPIQIKGEFRKHEDEAEETSGNTIGVSNESTATSTAEVPAIEVNNDSDVETLEISPQKAKAKTQRTKKEKATV
ncbi:MAG: DNA polymerase III subunit beta [Scytonematopsis contorta HA4267-MV1]|jgi:DNA polymerase-3 subunit beta|nr:DNA polymerase III subunit beta [Scytonematopsis contorta HA4267-MV1]